MRMQLGVPYVSATPSSSSSRTASSPGRTSAKHRWRYEFMAIDRVDGEPRTEVTETFDWSTSIAPAG